MQNTIKDLNQKIADLELQLSEYKSLTQNIFENSDLSSIDIINSDNNIPTKILECFDEFVWLVSVNTYRVVWANRLIKIFFESKYKKKFVNGMPLESLTEPPELYEFWLTKFKETKIKKEIQFEYYDVFLDNYFLVKIKLITINDSEDTFYINSKDISHEKQVEILLKESEEKFYKTFKMNPCAISILEFGESIKIIDVNDAFCSNLGYTREEIIGKNRLEGDFFDDIDVQIQFMESVKKNKKILNFEHQYRTKNGEFRTGILSAELIHINSKDYLISTNIDITDRKILEDDLIVAKERAEESDRLKSSFLANLSHEIRTPINAIVGFSNILIDMNLSESEKIEFLKIIKFRSNDLLKIINDLIDISKIETNQLVLNEFAGSIIDLLEDMYLHHNLSRMEGKENITFKIKNETQIHEDHILTDFVRVNQILNNLLNNAFKFTHEGEITLGCKIENKKNILFYVSDTGIGIDMHNKGDLFRTFTQLDDELTRNYEGTGLGLSISKGLVDLLGGEIWYESEKEKGSTFYFTIPYNPISEIYDEVDDSNIDICEIKNRTILIIEDDNSNLLYLEKLLSNFGFTCVIAKNGKSSLEIYKNYPKIDLVLMDIKLPDISGFELTKQMKLIKSDIPIIAQTALVMDINKEKLNESGWEDLISKPIDKELLKSKIFKLLHLTDN